MEDLDPRALFPPVRRRRTRAPRFWARSARVALAETAGFFGWNARTLGFTGLSLVGGLALHRWLSGPQPMMDELFLWSVYVLAPVGALAVGLTLFNLFRAPALLYAQQADVVAELQSRITALENRAGPQLAILGLQEETENETEDGLVFRTYKIRLQNIGQAVMETVNTIYFFTRMATTKR